jgi:hypothetical protein
VLGGFATRVAAHPDCLAKKPLFFRFSTSPLTGPRAHGMRDRLSLRPVPQRRVRLRPPGHDRNPPETEPRGGGWSASSRKEPSGLPRHRLKKGRHPSGWRRHRSNFQWIDEQSDIRQPPNPGCARRCAVPAPS